MHILRSRSRLLPLAFLAALAVPLAPLGCAVDAAEDFEDGSSEDELRALSAGEIVGTLASGETKHVVYTKKPTYRALRLDLAAGAKVDLWVRSASGDPQAWLLGSRFQTLSSNRDASATDPSAHIVQTVRTGGTYYLAFRDEKSRNATFDVTFVGAPPPPPPAPEDALPTSFDATGKGYIYSISPYVGSDHTCHANGNRMPDTCVLHVERTGATLRVTTTMSLGGYVPTNTVTLVDGAGTGGSTTSYFPGVGSNGIGLVCPERGSKIVAQLENGTLSLSTHNIEGGGNTCAGTFTIGR